MSFLYEVLSVCFFLLARFLVFGNVAHVLAKINPVRVSQIAAISTASFVRGGRRGSLHGLFVSADNEALWAEGQLSGGRSSDRCCCCMQEVGALPAVLHGVAPHRPALDVDVPGGHAVLLAAANLPTTFLVALMHDVRGVLRDVFDFLHEHVLIAGVAKTKGAAQQQLRVGNAHVARIHFFRLTNDRDR